MENRGSDIEDCRRRSHKIYDDGKLWFCYRDHVRTDSAFAAHSRELLERIKNTKGITSS